MLVYFILLTWLHRNYELQYTLWKLKRRDKQKEDLSWLHPGMKNDFLSQTLC